MRAKGPPHTYRKEKDLMLHKKQIQRLVAAFALLLAARSFAQSAPAPEVKAPVSLQTEHLLNPVGIDIPHPRLSWKLLAAGPEQRNLRQHSYQILVADTKDGLAGGEGNLWDTGRVVSEAQFDVRYAGNPLESSQICYWKVRVWTEDGRPASDWIAPARWVTGLMEPADWKAKWMGPNRATRPDYDLKGAQWIWHGQGGTVEQARAGAAVYYGSFDAPEDVQSRNMIMALTADDRYEVRINGKAVAQCWGHVNEWRWMRFLPVAKFLKPGENHIAVNVTNTGRGATGLLLNIRDRELSLLSSGASWRHSLKADKKTWQSADADLKDVKVVGGPDALPWGGVIRRDETASPAFEKTFSVSQKPVGQALLHITGLGFYEASLNGQRIGRKVLDPIPTKYDKRVLYSTYDLGDQLQPGENTLKVLLGHGWYDQRSVAVWNFDNAPWRDFPRMIAQLEIVYADGSSEMVISDETWRQVKSPVGYDDIREGMVLGLPHPDEPDFKQRPLMAEVVSAPRGILTASPLPPSVVRQTFKPRSVRSLGENHWVVDFGQNMAGWVDLNLSGQQKGDRITLLYGERLGADGSVNTDDLARHFRFAGSARLMPDGEIQRELLVCDGTDGWRNDPHFSYYGFQYVEIEGLKRNPDADAMVASAVCTDFKDAGRFECSNPLLNELQHAARWAYIGNYVNGVPTDCPHREKNGWTGDAQLAAEMGMYNFDNVAGYEKWVQDIMDEQQPDGSVPAIIPTSGWGYKWGNGPAWDSALVLIPWMLYVYKGDLQMLERSYAHMKSYVDYMTSRSKHGLVDFGLGDWAGGKTRTPRDLTSSGYYYMDTLIVARTARLLGHDADARNYEKLADEIQQAFHQKFHAGDGIYSVGSQTALSCTLHQGLAPESTVAATRAALVKRVGEDGGHPDFGILGSKYMFRALSEAGRTDLAYAMLNKRGTPSFSDWIVKGKATTLWEHWDGKKSRNHIMFGDFSAWMYQYLAGIRLSDDVSVIGEHVDPDKVAFKAFIIAPVPVDGLDHCSAEHDSPYGTIKSEWRVAEGAFSLNVEVPVNATAMVYVPLGADKEIDSDPVLNPVEVTEHHSAYEVGSGRYVFSVGDGKTADQEGQ